MSNNILPVGPLMKEHRFIERMIAIIGKECRKIAKTNQPDLLFLGDVVDFFKVYADKYHHGKEEDILFARLRKKLISDQHSAIIDRLLSDHCIGRKIIADLENTAGRFSHGCISAAVEISEKLDGLRELYPPHIELEDKHFFLPCMGYFDDKERGKMLADFAIFDKGKAYDKYKEMVKRFEERKG